MNAIKQKIQELNRRHFRSIQKILNKNSHLFTSFIEATPKQDMEEGFDAIFTFPDVKIPIRIRENKYKSFRDITIRSKLDSGYPTEYDKICQGFGDYYFYCWETRRRKSISCYVILDLNRFRESRLIYSPTQEHIPNIDGRTYFYAYDLEGLIKNEICLIYESLEKKTNAQSHNFLLPAVDFR